jgi:hypothetical protein
MHYCKRCNFPIADAESEKRKRWCQSIRRLLILGAVRPEDYHEECFMDGLMQQSAPTSRGHKSQRHAAVADVATTPPPSLVVPAELHGHAVYYSSSRTEASHV